jgi:hypothetical protein
MGGHEVAIHVAVSVAEWRAMKRTILMTVSLLMIRGLEEGYDPKRIEVTERHI